MDEDLVHQKSQEEVKDEEDRKMVVLLSPTNSASMKKKVHRIMALNQSVSTLNMLDATHCGLGRR